MNTLLSVRSAARAFGGLRAVRGVSFEMARGEILGIIGPNGAGKSTLFGMIAGQIRPDAGEIVLEGQTITGMRPESVVRKGLVKTFQVSRPFTSMSFLENVMVGPLATGASVAQARERARESLAAVGLAGRADDNASWGSTGQRKRLEIARALVLRPSLLLLDEPFGGVDLPSIDALIDTLGQLRDQGLSLLLIEHNLDAVQRLCDRLIAMHLGELLTSGRPEAVTTDARVVRAYMGVSEV